MKQTWRIEEGEDGKQLVMVGPWDKSAEQRIKKGGVSSLVLNRALGWKGEPLGFLSELSEYLEGILIIDHSSQDVSPVNSLGNLRRLILNSSLKGEVDFKNFPKLEYCCLEWQRGVRSVFNHRGVKSLFMNLYPGEDFGMLSEMTQLERLYLRGPRVFSLRGIEKLVNLELLDIGWAPRLLSIDGIQVLRKLKWLELAECKKVEDFSPIGELEQLEALDLSDNGGIASLKPFASMVNLQRFRFIESTNILDGDLSIIAKLPSLTYTNFQDRKHYSHKKQELLPNPPESKQ